MQVLVVKTCDVGLGVLDRGALTNQIFLQEFLDALLASDLLEFDVELGESLELLALNLHSLLLPLQKVIRHLYLVFVSRAILSCFDVFGLIVQCWLASLLNLADDANVRRLSQA